MGREPTACFAVVSEATEPRTLGSPKEFFLVLGRPRGKEPMEMPESYVPELPPLSPIKVRGLPKLGAEWLEAGSARRPLGAPADGP